MNILRWIIELSMIGGLALFLWMPEIKAGIRRRKAQRAMRKIKKLMTCPGLLDNKDENIHRYRGYTPKEMKDRAKKAFSVIIK